MTAALFGTDGIRGKVNQGTIRPQNFVRFGEALAFSLRKSGLGRPRIFIGRDTRQSGVMIEAAIIAGLVNGGADVLAGGVMPTPAVGYLTREQKFDAGLMITASHNPPTDNGVKIFGADGFKLSSDMQTEIEALIFSDADLFVGVEDLGRLETGANMIEPYLAFLAQSVDDTLSLKGMKICIDGANGAGCYGGTRLFENLGADVVSVGNAPNGNNINLDCGALHPEQLQELVLSHKADIGVALDGDADRIILVDEKGEIVDGDQIMGALALDFHQRGQLRDATLVATIMSNLGLERVLADNGIRLERTGVGDRYVVESMREHGFNVGGEQSGHIILSDWVTTGDAIITALQVLAMMKRTGRTASELLRVFDAVPQCLVNVRYANEDPLLREDVSAFVDQVKAELGERGRLVIRKSGTEPVIRVMAEAFSENDATTAVNRIVERIQLYSGG